MYYFLKRIALLLLLFCNAIPTLAQTDTSQVFGEYTVHYIAVNSSFINPEIAERYGIVRAPRNAFLNISVIKNTGGTGTPVAALLSGEKANFIGQNTNLDFIEINEGDAIYYIGQFEFSNAENLRFNLQIQPENNGPTYSLTWTSKLYIN